MTSGLLLKTWYPVYTPKASPDDNITVNGIVYKHALERLIEKQTHVGAQNHTAKEVGKTHVANEDKIQTRRSSEATVVYQME